MTMIISKVGLPILITTVIPLTVAKESKSCGEECESAIHAAVNFRRDRVMSGNIKGHTSDVKRVICMNFFITDQCTNKSELNLML